MTATTTTATTGAITPPATSPATSPAAGWGQRAGAAGHPAWPGLGWLYLIQAAQLALPLVSVPYLARVLGPATFGRVAAAQGLAMLAGVLVEYGFNLSGARLVARQRENPEALRRTFSALLGAQLVLLLAAVALVLLARPWIAFLAGDLALTAASLVWMVPQVISLQWYFQGVERMPWLAGWILAGRSAGLLGMLLWVAGPGDGALCLLVQGGCGVLALVIAASEPFGRLRPRWAGVSEVAGALGAGGGLFLYRAGLALQGAANTFVLALLLSPAAAGFYAGSERLAKAALGLLEPLWVTVFPRLAFLHGAGRGRDAAAFDRQSTWSIAAAGLLVAVTLWVGAPGLVGLLLGPGYGPAVPLLRIFALWPLASALSQMRGLSGLVARGRDRQLTCWTVAAGAGQLVGLFLLAWLAPRWLREANLLEADLLEAVAAWVVFCQFALWLGLERAARGRSC